MIKYRPNEFYLLASYLRPVLQLANDSSDSDHARFVTAMVEAKCSLLVFTGEVIDKFLPASKKRAETLSSNIDDVIFKRQVMGMPNVASIKTQIKQLETVLDTELSAAPIFCLERIGNLSTDNLLQGACRGYAADTLAVLEQKCKDEIDESGKCLAFERATASAFHILRAVELTITQYLLSVKNFVMPPLNRQNWGEYIKLLKDNGADKKVIDAIQNLKDNYRNPLMHPQDRLDMQEAINLFCVCQGLVETLIADMKKRGLM